jgi:hypothetical protein
VLVAAGILVLVADNNRVALHDSSYDHRLAFEKYGDF